MFDACREELREWFDGSVGREERWPDGIVVVSHVRIVSEFDGG
ncbi:MAG: hypothetical protein WA484_02640 [Solirubrobacteraceae bacterium]